MLNLALRNDIFWIFNIRKKKKEKADVPLKSTIKQQYYKLSDIGNERQKKDGNHIHLDSR